ncbi:lipoyl(octanoyl) transferase LipB [Accumulibacter sp.]|uniref:lipoyl(octanoyl) transferase LipB n=1 Tax=Accumulibacter sp. TaxID=2053492 RepID=UPI0025E400CB|nr:lipoyl(octanoyl) transferase LipB [Accumulibacter sp.]MCM8612642.1 lipoyl(octanoyl) transferase LipB [Accumulibacter sp.]MCM8636096.1 lipoyl(octanoyl) transferase LipB [Accumulibacter sp.]MCM8639960.1 lipoyl(octanoyl) transferase LipB [Accumulibacter sp.]
MPLLLRHLGCRSYPRTWQEMVAFTAARDEATGDELWSCEHPPVFTLGQAGRPEHLLFDPGIPLLRTDRGGQITYHGPGQVVIYLLLDLARRRLKVRALVVMIEQAVIELLAENGVAARRHAGAPGVYVGAAKVAALGLRVRRNCCYHGVSLNVDMDLSPFAAINPCGFPGLPVTQTSDLGIALTPAQAATALAGHLARQLEGKQ